MSYGEVAAEAGYPGAARAVGNVLATVEGLPWWRVVTANGRLIPHDPAEHARRLAAEGVRCRNGYVLVGS
jgi:methylated-DNA-protein-cysteine methyltransferase-like protein